MGLFSNIFKKKQPLLPLADLSSLKNDIHSHLIPGIDDGAQTMSDSLEMLKVFKESGYKKVITTPHIMSDYYRNTPEIINAGLADLKKQLKSNGIDIEIEAAAEYNVEPDFEEIIKNDNVLTFGGSNKYVLIELSFLLILYVSLLLFSITLTNARKDACQRDANAKPGNTSGNANGVVPIRLSSNCSKSSILLEMD